MACVNINSSEYKQLTKGFDNVQKFVARAVISRYQTKNGTGKLPDIIELKSMMSDLYNGEKAGVDYKNFYSQVRGMFKALIPSLTEDQLDKTVKFVDSMEIMRLRDGLPILSSFIDGTVYVANSLPQQRGEKAYTDVRHEIFHTIFNNFLASNEQIAMMESFKRWKPQYAFIQDKVQLEEAMANEFENYRFSPKKSIPVIIRDFFQDLLKFFGLVGDHYSDIQKLFSDVENGKFTRNYIKDGLVTRDKNIITEDERYSTNLDAFLRDKAFVLNNLNELMFPEDVASLSENSNNNLFLKQDYKSPLFQNNKETFKLGLTKNDALKAIQKRIDTLKADKNIDPQLTDTVKALSNKKRLERMFNYLQPYSLAEVSSNGELILRKQAEIDPTEELLESDESPNALQIGSKEFINPVTKISEVVKDFLSSISYPTSDGNVVNIDPGAGFVALLNLMNSMYGNTSIEDNLDSLKKSYNTTNKGNQTKAVYNKLKQLHEDVIGKSRMTLNVKGVSETELNEIKSKLDAAGIKHDNFKDSMNIILPDTMSVKNLGSNNVDNKVVFEFNRFKEGKESFLKEQKSGESNKNFVERIANETDIPSFVIAKLFKYNEQRNQLAELTKVANSLRKLSPKFVKVTTKRVTDEDSGQTANVTSYAFIDTVKDYKNSNSLSALVRDRLDLVPLRKFVISKINEYEKAKKTGDKKIFRNILKSIVTDNQGLAVISEDDFNKITDKDVSILLNNLTRISNFVPDFGTDKVSENFENSDVYLRHTSNFSTNLNKYTFEKNNPTSFSVSTANKSKWENVMPNTGYKIFKNLEDFANGILGVDKLIPFLKNSFNNYLRFNPILSQDYNKIGTFSVNTAMLKVGEDDYYSDHQETYFDNKNGFYQKPPVPFHRESPRDWINRNFLAMFQLPILESVSASRTERSNIAYYQQKFQPESAPNVSVVKMGVNSSEELREGLMNMVIQEAYLNHLSGGSIRGNLKKNSVKSFLPGLEGSTYFLRDGNNIFFDGAGNLNTEFGTVNAGRLVINKNNKELNRLVDTIMESLDGSLEKFVNMAIDEKATLDGSSIADMYEKVKNSYPKAYQLTDEELSSLKGISIDGKTDIEDLRSQTYFKEQFEALKKAMSVYYLNSYINGFFMNQLSSGATQNYKNPLDEVKRQAGVNAMNDTGLVDNEHGMPTNYRNVVISAANNFYGQSHRFANIPVLQRFFKNKKQEVGDAQSWDIPEYKDLLRKSFGKSVDIGVVTKDVHFEVNENGGVDYRKTSSAELTNDLVKKNKTLRDLRYKMTFGPMMSAWSKERIDQDGARVKELYDKLVDNNGLSDVNDYMQYQDFLKEAADTMIHKASFDSAIKGSKPSKLSSFTKNEDGTFDFNLESQSVLNLNSNFNGIQQAVRHRYIDDFISHFTQLTYLIGLNRTDTSIKNNKAITRTLSRFAKAGIYDTLFDFRMAYKDDNTMKANLRSRKEFIVNLKKKLELPGNERLLEMLNIPGVSMNNPLFSEKLMQTFFNGLTKKTVSPKHPGGSFVLQSEFGFEASKALKENSLRTPELVTDEKGNLLYAEAYVPEMYSDQLKHGDLLYYNSEQYNKMFGFRIPSSDLHSSVPLKVIGYYPSKSHDNVIVMPSAVTALHGSDFDVDKLFVVRQGVYGVSQDDIDPKNIDQETPETSNKREYKTRFQNNNVTIAQKGIKFGYTAPNAEYDQKGNIVSFGQDEKHTEVFNMEGVLLNEKESTQNRIVDLESNLSDFDKETVKLNLPKWSKERVDRTNERSKMRSELKSLEDHLKQLRDIQKGLYSNQVLNSVLDNISYSGENASDILFGITFDPVKGYEEDSEYSQLARVYSDINKANGSEDLLSERPKMYKNLQEALDQDPKTYQKIESNLRDNLGVDVTTKEGKEDLLALINDDLQSTWIDDRDEFIRRQRGTGSVNINKVEDHATVHKETYMAAGLVGLIANFSKGLAYAFHGITDGKNEIELDIPETDAVEVDGEKFNSLVLSNKDGIKNQELRSLALNAAIDHVKEQILNVLNVGNNTAKIFLAAISTKMNMHQATMLMLQPVAKELNSSNATTIGSTLGKMATQITEKLAEMQKPLSQEDINNTKITTKDLEKFVKTSFSEIYNDVNNPKYRQNLVLQFKVLSVLTTLNNIGNEVSNVSQVLSIIQGLPYNLESAYDKLKTMDNYINIDKLFSKFQYSEKSEYTENGFKEDLRNSSNILKNVNLANNENILGALEAIKVQIDVASEIFSENSVQAQFIVNNIIKSVSNNSDPATMFTGENDQNLTFDTAKNMTNEEKYLKGRNTFNLFKMISRNIFNYMTTGMNVSYNNDQHLLSLGIKTQDLQTVKDAQGNEFQLSAVKSYVNAFLMKESDAYDSTKNYDGDNFVVSQINPEWRVKPLSVIKKQNSDNKFLRGIGIDLNFRDKIRVMNFNSGLVNSQENLAEIEQAAHGINNLSNIYVRKDKKGRWVDVPSSLHPVTPEMNEVMFNIVKTSVYTDKLKFSSNKVTNVIPPIYFKNIFLALQTLTKDLLIYNKSNEGNKYYKDFSDLENQTNQFSAMSNIKENLFINTIFSLPSVLPNLRTILPTGVSKWKMVNRQAGIMTNGNIYDLYFDANILDKQSKEEAKKETNDVTEPTQATTNVEVTEDVEETNAQEDLFERLRKNPSFIADEDNRKPGNYEIYMKVGSTGTKEANDLKYYYKKIGAVNGSMTNNSFDLNLLLNKYKISDYYNPKRLAIPVRNVDFSGNKVNLNEVRIGSFLLNFSDDLRTRNLNKEQIKEAEQQMFEFLRNDPENKLKTDSQIKEMVKTKINVENVINQINEVSLYDSRNLDRVGIRNFKVLSRKISSDKRTVSFELEALPEQQQVRFDKFDKPLELLKTVKQKDLSRQEKIDRINSIPGADVVTSAQNLTDAELDLRLQRAEEVDEAKEVDKVLKNKNKCK